MPFIRIQLLEGRDAQTKEKAAKEIALAAANSLNAPIERITIIFEDMKKEDYYPKGEKINS